MEYKEQSRGKEELLNIKKMWRIMSITGSIKRERESTLHPSAHLTLTTTPSALVTSDDDLICKVTKKNTVQSSLECWY